MNSLFARPARVLAALSLIAVSIDGLAAQKTYATAYRFTTADLKLRLRWNTSAILTETTNLAAQGYRMIDLNSYRDATGAVKHDATYLPYTGGYRFYTSMGEADFVGTTSSLVSQGFQLNTFSSYATNNGTRVYAANYLQGTGGGRLRVGQTRTEFLNGYAANISVGERLAAFDTYVDTNNVQRYDSLFVLGFNETQSIVLGMSQAQFESRRVTELQAGRRMWMFKAYYGSTNQPRYDAVYRAAGTVQTTRLFFAETEAEMIAQLQAQAAQGFRLADVEPTFRGTLPERNDYGIGLAGTLGVPRVAMANPPTLGRRNSLSIIANSGEATNGALLIGLTPLDFPIFGGNVLVNPTWSINVSLPTNLVKLNTFYPGNPAFDGAKLYYQAIVLDDGAPEGLSFSRGLELVIGRRD